MINLTVFCSSKNNLDLKYYLESEYLIKSLDVNKFNIAYGGGVSGLMGTVRRTFTNAGGKVISSNVSRFVELDKQSPDYIYVDDYVFDNIDERQQKLIALGDAYLILPGGYGTHFEMLEVMTKNDIGEESKPIFIFNLNGIFDNLIKLVDNLIAERFITRDFKKIKVFVAENPLELADLINNYNYTK
jgi:uncharacterized protein (TIGR00730 family)